VLSRIDVRLLPDAEERGYPIFLDPDADAEERFADELARRARGAHGTGKIALVTDETVSRLHRARYQRALEERGLEVVTIAVADGEGSKSLATVEAVCEAWAQARLDRGAWVVALGGGVVGDLAGFCASIFLRGLPCVQVPTTLLAQVDSSVGGKTGVNLAAGKNLVGTFWQPKFVYADLTTLRTLPKRDLAAGMAEVIKHGVIADARLLELVEEHGADALATERAESLPILSEYVARSCVVKARVVAADERETRPAGDGGRAQLNFGHTIGHAIEAASLETAEPLRHGEAVALGMIAAARIGARLGVGDAGLEKRLVRLLRQLGLPTDLDRRLDAATLARVGVDKKRVSKTVNFVVVKAIGAPALVPVEPAALAALLLDGKSG
jgi:3-dehydroquinate synthase